MRSEGKCGIANVSLKKASAREDSSPQDKTRRTKMYQAPAYHKAAAMATVGATTTGFDKTPTCTTKSIIKLIKKPNFLSLKRQDPVPQFQTEVSRRTVTKASGSSATTGSTPGLYSAQKFELTAQNVDLVLDDVRPYLIADGGNVDVVSVEDGVISLKLQGACGSCPSSTTTMKMGIERVLKEKFGDAVKDIQQVYDEQIGETTVEAVNRHLDILRPAIKNYGGIVEVVSVESGECVVVYTGPETIGSGIKAAIKEKFPDITHVIFSG